jgi:phosphatidylglycerophosphate synthase
MAVAVTTPSQRYGYAASLALTLLRLALAVPLLLLAIARGSGKVVAIILCVGFVSDVYDGVIARRFGVATAGLRRLDSGADTVFYLAAALCVWRLHAEAVLANRWLLIALFGTLILNHMIEFLKFGREASYHAWSAKAWGVALFVALVGLFAAGSQALIPVALWLGILSHLENLAITLALPAWRHDVPSVVQALSIRRAGEAALSRDRSST